MVSRWIAILLVMIGASSYGLLSSVVKLAYQAGWGDHQVTISQVTMGALLLWIMILLKPSYWSNPFRGPWMKLGLIGIFGVTLCTICYNISLSELDASVAIVLLFQFTWIAIALESVTSRTWPKPKQWLAVGTIVLGTVLAVNVKNADWERFTGKGVVFGLLAAFSYALFLFGTGKIKTTMHPVMKSAVMITSSLPILYLIYPPYQLGGVPATSLILVGVVLGILGTVVPAIAFNIGIPRIGGSLAAMLGSLELPAAIVSAFFILGESVHSEQWFGMLIILAGIAIAERGK